MKAPGGVAAARPPHPAATDEVAFDERPRLRAIARLETLDGLRSRRQLVLRMLTPVVLFLIVLAVTFLTRSAPGTRTDPYVVAVQGDITGARHTLDQLSPDRLRFVPSNDATLDAARIADVGMQLPDRLDERLAAGEAASVVLFESAMAPESRSAAAHIRSGFGQLHEAKVLEASKAKGETASSNVITVDVIDVQRTTQAATQLQTAGLVTAIVLLQASMLVSTTATRLLSRRNRGLLAAQLLLPFERWRLGLSKGLAELTVGVITAIPVLVVTTAVAAWTTQDREGVGAALVAALAVLVCFLVLAMAMVAIGLLIGTISRTHEQVSLVSAIVVVLAAVIASRVALAGLPPTIVDRFIPIVGLVASTQRLLLGSTSDGGWILVGVATTLLLALLLVRWAGRAFNAERLVLRGST